jgi:hypothetical protein
MGEKFDDKGPIRRRRRIQEYNIQLDVRETNMGLPQLRWRDQHILQEDGTGNARPNP